MVSSSANLQVHSEDERHYSKCSVNGSCYWQQWPGCWLSQDTSRVVAGIGAEMVGWNDDSGHQGDGHSDLCSGPLFGEQEGSSRLGLQEVQSCTTSPLLEGLVCKSPESGCDQKSEAMGLYGCGPSSDCGEYLPRERRSCDVQDGPQLWNATTLLWDEPLPREVGMERCF